MKGRPNRVRSLPHVIVLLIPIVILLGVVWLGIGRLAPVVDTRLRETRIKAVYQSLRLDASYLPQSSDIFGDKRYSNAAQTSTQPSSATFVRGTSVSVTANDLKARAVQAGFTYLGERQPTGIVTVYRFRDQHGAYLVTTVSSKPRDDVIENKTLMKQQLTNADYALDPDAGPSDITIKVDIDGPVS